MYQTKQKKQLLDFLKNNMSRQFSTNDIISAICPDGTTGKSTIYRQIAKLVDEGTLLRLSGDDAKNIVYQYVGDDTKCCEHFHLKCTDCGKLVHLDCEKLSQIGIHISKEHNFIIDTKKTVFYGLCSNCR